MHRDAGAQPHVRLEGDGVAVENVDHPRADRPGQSLLRGLRRRHREEDQRG
jgi:hypothetical protein